MAAPPPIPHLATLDTDLEVATAEEYRRFIQDIRRLLPRTQSRLYGFLRLLLQNNANVPLFDVDIGRTGFPLTLRLRSDDLYLVGFRGNSGRWYTFDSAQRLIPGSTSLGFDCGYDALEWGGTRNAVPLNAYQLSTAVDMLSFSGNSHGNERRRPLMIIIQMISEAVRLHPIFSNISDNFLDVQAPPPSQANIRLENSWADLSYTVQRLYQRNREQNLGQELLPWSPGPGVDVPSLAAARRVLAVMKFLEIGAVDIEPEPEPERLKKRSRLARNENDSSSKAPPPMMNKREHAVSGGHPLLEIFWARINNIDGEEPGQLYGTINATDGLGTQQLFSIPRSRPLSTYPNTNLVFNGYGRAISAAGQLIIDVDLMDYDAISSDDQVSKGRITWNPSTISNDFDTAFQQTVSTDKGSTTFSYAVMEYGLEVKIDVVLVNGDGENPASVYGTINALASESSRYPSIPLFSRTKSQTVDVVPDRSIPLSRSVVACPTNGLLVVDADLWDYDYLSSDDRIAFGSVTLPPLLMQSNYGTIIGPSGVVDVRAQWL